MAMSTAGLILIDPFSSFGNINKQLNHFQKSGLLFYKDSNGKIKPVTTAAEWKIKQKQILNGMQEAMGKLPEFSNLPAMNIQIIDEVQFLKLLGL